MSTRLFFCGFICLFTICCCFHSSKERNNKSALIRTIGFFDSLPMLSNTADREEDNFIFYSPQEPRLVSFYKQYRLYRVAAYKDWNIMTPVNDSLMEGRVYKSDTSYYYYARVDTAQVVYRFNSLTNPVFKKISVDSLYSRDSDYHEPCIEAEKIWQETINIRTYTQNDLVTDVYAAIPNRSKNLMDTLLLVYSNNKFWDNIPFAFSHAVEARKKMKLVKYRLVSNGDPGSKSIFKQKPSMMSSEMKEIHPSNEKELLNAFLAFENFLNNQ